MSAKVALVQTALSQYANGQIEEFLGILSPTCVWKEPEGGSLSGEWVGPAAILENLFKPLAEAWEWRHVSVDAIYEAPNGKVYVQGVEEGTNRATGKSATSSFTHVLTIDGGQLTSFEHITDTHIFREIEA